MTKKTEITTLKQLCKELKIDSVEALERLRAAIFDHKKFPELVKSHKPSTPRKWGKGSAGEKEARKALNYSQPPE